MNISLIAPTFLPARRANTIQVMKMAQALAQCDHHVEVLVPDPYPAQTSKTNLEQRGWPALALWYGLETQFPIHWLPIQPGWRNYDYGWCAYQYAKKSRSDLIYTRLPQAAAIASMLGTPTIYETHDFPNSLSARMLFRRFISGRGARRLVVITHTLAEDLHTTFGARIREPFTVIAPDGVDLARYRSLPSPAAARQELGLLERFTVGYTGHLYPGRGSEMLLELAARLPEVSFLLAGGEPADVDRLRLHAAQRLLSNVTITGFISNAELPHYQAACEMLLMPYETQVAASSGGDISRYLSPMKLFEYLASGKIILASNLPVLGEALNSENAILLPSQDSNAWVEAIRNRLQFPERYRKLAEQAQRDAQLYTWNARVRKIFET